MRNYYHLALETPEPNLVEGLQWLQSTYANRFNRFRRVVAWDLGSGETAVVSPSTTLNFQQ
jgi:hypothetical protein